MIKNKAILISSLIIISIIVIAFIVFSSNNSPQDLTANVSGAAEIILGDEPLIVRISALPQKVKVGDILTITAEIQDKHGIEKVSVIMPHERGADEFQLSLISGDAKSGKWQGRWKAYDTINKEYITKVIAVNVLGKSATAEVSWWDDTETTWWPGEPWVGGFSKRKKITITGSTAGAQSNYQVKVTVAYDSDMQNDFDDIRFANANGTLLDHWLESKTDGVTADFWVEIDSIPANPFAVDIYFYYGNPSAASSSNGANTFIFFDDFENYALGDLVGQGGWTFFQGVSGEWDIQNSVVHGGSKAIGITTSFDGNQVYKNLSIPYDFELTSWRRMDSATRNHLTSLREGTTGRNLGFRSDNNLDGGRFSYYTAGSVRVDTGITPTLTAWYKERIIVKSNKLVDWYLYDANGALLFSALDRTMSSDFVTGIDNILLIVGNPPSTEYMDDFRVRKYVSPEPSVGTAGSEEAQGTWPLRKKITLSSSTPSANYQVKVELTTAIMGNPYTNVKTNGDDIRFAQANGTLLDYWIETWNASGNSTIWVEVATSGTSQIYMYYGNPSAASASNGANTFDFFDDFNRADGAPGSGWVVDVATVEIYSNYLRGYNGYAEAHKGLTTMNGVWEMDFRIYHRADGLGDAFIPRFIHDGTNYYDVFIAGDVGTEFYRLQKNWVDMGTAAVWSHNHDWNKLKITRYNGNFELFLNGISKDTAINTDITTNSNFHFYVWGWGTGAHEANMDNIRVRKYASPEPTTTVNIEEKRPNAAGTSPSGGGFFIF